MVYKICRIIIHISVYRYPTGKERHMADLAKTIMDIRDLDISFKTPKGRIHAIRGVNLTLRKGETLAIVGESGSGKSVTMKAVMGILPHNAVINGGTIDFSYDEDGKEQTVDLLKKDRRWLEKEINGRRIGMIFQDPMTSLNPTMKIGNQLAAAILSHEKISRLEANSRAVTLLEEVGITSPKGRMNQYPHQLSGGMRQRVVIAIALSCNPEVLICDEPTTALDVTVQEKILNLIRMIQIQRGLSVVFITHNMGVVANVADYVNVMYAGKVVESGTIMDIFYDPRHPYTWGLLSAIPDVNASGKELYSIPGTPPDLRKEIVGDAFAPRNRYAMQIDYKKEPPLFQISNSHFAATWLLDERAPKVERPKELEHRIEKLREEAKKYVLTEE